MASDLIYDIGAHEGEDSDFYLKLGYRVVAVEANPVLAEKLKARFSREIGAGKYILVQKAIADSPGSVTFHVNAVLSDWGTADPRWAERNRLLGADSTEIEVEGIRFSEVVCSHGCPFYLKIDIEGADMLCLNGLVAVQCRPKYVSIESTKTSWADLIDEFDTLVALGYSRFKVVNQSKHRGGMFRDRNGQLIRYIFEYGATGPFGEHLEGFWLTRQQAIRRYVGIFLIYRIIGDNTILERILRRIPFVRRVLGLVPWYDTHAMRE